MRIGTSAGCGVADTDGIRRSAKAGESHFKLNWRNHVDRMAGWMLYIDGHVPVWIVSVSGSNLFADLAPAGFNGGTGVTAAAWHHFAVDWDGTKQRLYCDGATIATSTTARTINSLSMALSLGTDNNNNNNNNNYKMNGYLDEVRVTKGVARYASDSGYTVPTAAFPRS